METMVIPVPAATLPHVQVNVHVQADILSSETVRRLANVWLLENAGNLLRAESPELVLGDRLVWRVDVMLTSPTRGTVGRVGRLKLDAATGAVLADESTAQEIIVHARTLVGD